MVDVTLPSLGESVTEGIVIRWMKAVGDTVERDEPLYEVSTDKVDSEVPAPASGILTEIIIPEGGTVMVGERLGVIGDADAPRAPVTPISPQGDLSEQHTTAPQDEGGSPTGGGSPRESTAPGKVLSPLVRRILQEASVDPTGVTGTGLGGRITRADAERAVRQPLLPEARTVAQSPEHAVMARVASEVVAGFVSLDADFEAVDDALKSAAGRLVIAEGIDLGPTVFAVRAAVEALAEFPTLNAWSDEGIGVVNASRNVGIEVALDEGLAVPVIADAQDLALRGLARKLGEVTARALTHRLDISELMNATFTVSVAPDRSVGHIIPVVTEPQVAVLSVGGIARRARVVVTEAGDEAIVIRSTATLGLAFDSRVVDSHLASKFLARVAQLIADQDWTAEL